MADPQRALGKKAKAVLILVLLACLLQAYRNGAFGRFLANDYVEFWGGARIAISGGDPYLPVSLLAIEKSVGWADPTPLMMWNPPWTITLVLPFAGFGFKISAFIWLVFLACVTFGCSDWLWAFYGGARVRRSVAFVVTSCFLPVLLVLRHSQITPVVLLGVVGFLYFEQRKKDVPAGAALVLASIKPHLLAIFWLALLLWVIKSRRWRVLAGFAAALAVATGIAFCADPDILTQYHRAIAGMPMLNEYFPMFGGLLRILFGPGKRWLQFIPTAAGAAWVFVYWLRRDREWQWAERMPAVVVASLLTASYAWSYDQVLLLPAVIQIAVAMESFPKNRKLWMFGVYVAINAAILMLNVRRVHEVWLLWTMPAWIAAYMVALRTIRGEGAGSTLAGAAVTNSGADA